MNGIGEFTALFGRLQSGDNAAGELIYRAAAMRLRRMAKALMRRENRTGGFDTEDLLQQTYLDKRSICSEKAVEGREHYFALMFRGMKQVLVDRSRRKKAAKRTFCVQAWRAESLGDARLRDLGHAMEKLRKLDARAYRVVRLRHEYGLKWEEVATREGIETWAARRDFAFAMEWLRDEMSR